jgi:hypothetical protein
MLFFPRHPSVDELVELAPRSRVAAHLERCSRCRNSLQLLRAVAPALEETPEPSPALRARVLASRAQGVRMIVPLPIATSDTTVRRTGHRLLPLAAAAVLAAFGGLLLTRTTREVQGSATTGTLVMSPAMPRAATTVVARYEPGARLGRERLLILRGRLRSANGGAYNSGIPTTTLAVLRRQPNGVFSGSFTLPDSIVYGALAVEDSAAGIVDDDGGRDWEVLVAGEGGTPRFEALDQRAQDMMGRNWEEGFATARRMVSLYPDDVRAWLWLRTFQGWLGQGEDDSVLALHRAKLAEFDSRVARAATVSSTDLGYLAWYAAFVDSATAQRWRAQLLRDAPGNSFALQWRLLDAVGDLYRTSDTATALRRLEVLWKEAPPDRLSQVAMSGTAIADASRDTSAMLRWSDRMIHSARDAREAARWTATRLSGRPALRREGVRRLRDELAALAELPEAERGLGETRALQRERHAAIERTLLASLGQALVAAGDRAAGLDTLARAAAAGWDVGVFRAARAAALAAGDTATAFSMAAREAVDPRTEPGVLDTLRSFAASRIGARDWSARLDAARAELVERVLASGSTRSLAGGGAVRLMDVGGDTQELRALADGRVTVVAFWSRFCLPAVQELPKLNAAAARLTSVGVRVIGIVEEASLSPELHAFLYQKHVTMPTYLDAWHEASRAFNQWGMPYYYVLDPAGRVRFDVVTSADELLVRAEALRLSVVSDRASR